VVVSQPLAKCLRIWKRLVRGWLHKDWSSDAAAKKPIAKDRIGLVLDKKSTDTFTVAFVAPNSPAEAAGFKKGEKIAAIDGKAFPRVVYAGNHCIPDDRRRDRARLEDDGRNCTAGKSEGFFLMPEEDFALKVTFFGKFGSDRLKFPITPFFAHCGGQ